MHLVLGSKRFSTWSLRPWILLKELNIPFSETVIELDYSTTRPEILKYSPSGRVPCLMDGELIIWDSLSIFEYIHENHGGVWPADKKLRAWCRSVAAEMHSGFTELRKNLSGQFLKTGLAYEKTAEVLEEIDRIKAIWKEGLTRNGGPFLAGKSFSGVDAMFAPVALGRFIPYGVELKDPQLEAYVKQMASLATYQQWVREAATDRQ